LELRASEAKLIAEPVDVEERGGELVEDEGEAVVISEWFLEE
jgi:hypothetical protein